MKTLSVLLAVAALVFVSCSAHQPVVSTVELTPPKTISVQQALVDSEAGWQPFKDDVPLSLMSVALFEGHPDERASLIPDEETEAQGRRISTWQLRDNGERRYWIVCYYDRTKIALAHLIDPGISACVVTSDLTVSVAGRPAILDISFK
jgi:hypothetical protein